MEPGSYTNVSLCFPVVQSTWLTILKQRGPLGIPYDSHVYSQISPAFLDADPPILLFGSDADGMYYVNLTVNIPTIEPNPKNAQPKEMIASQLRPCSFHRNLTQDPFLYQHTNGYTYAFFTNGLNFPGSRATYNEYERIEVCRSKYPHWGYVNALGQSCLEPGEHPTGKLVIESHGNNVLGPGSPAVIDAPGVGPYLIYQYGDPSDNSTRGSANRLYGHNFMDFSSGWPVLVENNANTTVTPKHSAADRIGISGVGIVAAFALLLFANS